MLYVETFVIRPPSWTKSALGQDFSSVGIFHAIQQSATTFWGAQKKLHASVWSASRARRPVRLCRQCRAPSTTKRRVVEVGNDHACFLALDYLDRVSASRRSRKTSMRRIDRVAKICLFTRLLCIATSLNASTRCRSRQMPSSIMSLSKEGGRHARGAQLGSPSATSFAQ
jgi:hypothetical protein